MSPIDDVLATADAAWDTAPSSLKDARDRARHRFEALGFPTTSDEEWRFTSVAPIAGTKFAPAVDRRSALRRADVAPFSLVDASAIELVFVNGLFSSELSSIPTVSRGLRVESLAAELAAGHSEILEKCLTRVAPFEQRAFTALNTGLFVDGAFIHVPAGDTVDAPIHLLFIATTDGRPAMVHPRVLVVVDQSAHASIVESYVSLNGDRYLTNAVTEVVVGENGSVDHYKFQRESLNGFHIASMHVITKRNARFQSHSLGFGGAIVRNDVGAVLDGEGGECTLNGLYLGDGRRLVDNHTTIDHAKPHCASHEVYKGILGGTSRAVFNGKIIVRQDAQKTDAKQTNRALLLTDGATINTKPQLEIFADDVKCTHGAAIGQLDEDAIFYLRARGLTFAESRDMLIHAFAGQILDGVRIDPLRAALEAELFEQLAKDLAEADAGPRSGTS